MGKLKDKWNKNNFSIYKSEEKTTLRLIENVNKFLGNEVIKELDQKTDLNGNHLGSWQGLDKPTLSEEGMRSTVEKLDSEYSSLAERMTDIYKQKDTILPSVLRGCIILDSSKVYNFTETLTIDDNSILIMNNATIQGSGRIILKNNSIIYGGIIICNDIITRDNDGVVTNTNGLPIDIKLKGAQIKNCHLKGCIINVDGGSNFIIEGNIIESGYALGGAISTWNNATKGVIRNNEIMGCNTNGIGVHTSNNIDIIYNKIHNNLHSGVWTPYSTYLNICFNESYLNNEDGLDLNFGADNDWMSFSAKTFVYGNTCHNNKKSGIYLVGGDVIIKKNFCYENYTNGIRAGTWRSGDTTFAENVQILYNRVLNNNKGGNATSSTYTHQMLLQRLNGATIKGNRITNPLNYPNSEYNLYCVVQKSLIAENFSKSASGVISIYIHEDTTNPLGNIQKDNILL